MATLTFNKVNYTVDHAVKGADYIHGYDADGSCVVTFDGITDFSGFTYDGVYMSPDACLEEACNDVKHVNGKLMRSDGQPVELALESDPIGTIKTTVRTDLGDNWLLCNGDTLTVSENPVLYSFAGKPICLGRTIVSSGTSYRANDVAYYNGRYVVAGYYNASSGKYYPYISTSTSLDGSWTTTQISTTNAYGDCIDSYNGTWVIGGRSYSSSYPYVWISTSPTGTWTEKCIDSANKFTSTDMFCYNGTWVFAGHNSSVPIVYVTNNPNGTWTRIELPSTPNADGKSLIRRVYCYNGTWVVAGSTSAYVQIFTTTNPTGTWVAKEISAAGSCSSGISLICANGTWAVTARYSPSTGSRGYIFTTNNPTGTWTAIDTGKIASSTTTWEIMHDGRRWVLGTGSAMAIYTSDSLNGPWVDNFVNKKSSELTRLAFDGTHVLAIGQTSSGNAISWSGTVLPEITVDNAYAYIKAKEG